MPVAVWPARIPDIHPIEHLGDKLKKRVRASDTAPTRLEKLRTAVNEEYYRRPDDFSKKLIYSIKRRMAFMVYPPDWGS